MQKDIIELDLKEYLLQFSKTKVDFFRFPGNYGDSLIYNGTKILLDELHIDINLVELDSRISNSTLFIDGGGNFVDEYNDVYNFLLKKHRLYKRIVLLPHTIKGNRQSKLIRTFGPNVTIFCRERITYEFVKKSITKAECYLWHDCAFYNNLKNYSKLGDGTLNAFRTDIESNRDNMPSENEDISYDGWSMKPLEEFFSKIQKYQEIRTDRLHVAIAGAMIGKIVLFYPNSYYKNMAVYEYSLSKYSNVIFIYENDNNYISYSQISKTFLLSLNSENIDIQHNISELFAELILLNHKLWGLEDTVRNPKLSNKLFRDAKKNIDNLNQSRNDIIRKIDFNLANLLNNCEEKNIEKFVSESPGMLLDRLSIMFIRKFEIGRLALYINDSNLLQIYNQKLNIINEQINFYGNFLDIFFDKIRTGNIFFKIYNPVKIYNDPNIQKYIIKSQL